MQSLDATVYLPESMQLPSPEGFDLDEVFVREEMLTWNVDESRDVVCFLSLVVGERAACREALAAIDAVRSFDVASVDDDAFYAYVEMAVRPADRALFAVLDGRQVVVVPPVVFGPDGEVSLTVLGDPGELREVVASLPDAVDVEIERVGEHRGLAGSLAGRLTARQFEALSVARDLGYYEVPREATLAEVAAALDCSESTASALLRKAQAALADAAVGR